ncbi:hypothetical protein UFOVP566_57 [uncultured Caudovirales phage]|uniref:Uncharacterized protein n=1 Tax=uncultured Caudovirales phage TaxID=2100421 RepID=A0A6J5LP44_9CAUD|nr:hypothetical protein UFOVP294_28 [uncultured Caudovirales phage]CAB4150613.1 hypothetical protein UFOVP566_57 [uncultured Caudovirales phage]
MKNEETKPNNVDLRDYFAAAALQGILANPQFCDFEWLRNFAAGSAYNMADRMLKERKK